MIDTKNFERKDLKRYSEMMIFHNFFDATVKAISQEVRGVRISSHFASTRRDPSHSLNPGLEKGLSSGPAIREHR